MTRIGRREERGCTSRCLRISGVHIAATKHDALDNSNLSILPTTPQSICATLAVMSVRVKGNFGIAMSYTSLSTTTINADPKTHWTKYTRLQGGRESWRREH